MASFLENIISDDFVWDAIVNNIHGRRKQSGTQFLNINCVMCTSRGETPDRRQRLGIKRNPNGSVGAHCFNCGFKAMFKRGELLSKNMRDLLLGLGMPEIEVKRLNHRAMAYRDLFTASPEAMALVPDLIEPHFIPMPLPRGAKSIEEWANNGCVEDDFIQTVEYLFSRGDDIVSSYHYFWSPDDKFRRRIIIPFRHEGSTVGYTARAIDKSQVQRYLMESQSNFLFNFRAVSARDRKFAILTEGVFDAIAIDGVATLGAHLNPQQTAWLKGYGKTIILLPDRDKNGARMIDTALLNNWHVAFPALRSGHGNNVWWESDVKDAAEATKRYGRVYTLQSIIATATDNKIKINQLRKLLY